MYAIPAAGRRRDVRDRLEDHPSWYLLGRQDRTITSAAQRFMANRAGSETVEINASHLSILSRPRAVVDLIEEAAAEVADDG